MGELTTKAQLWANSGEAPPTLRSALEALGIMGPFPHRRLTLAPAWCSASGTTTC